MAVAFRGVGDVAIVEGGTSVVVPVPASTVDGDILLMCVQGRTGSANSITLPTGWSIAGGNLHNAAGTVELMTCYRFASSEPADYTVTVTSGDATQRIIARIIAFSGVHPTLPINASGAVGAASALSGQTTTSITTTVADCMLVAAWARGAAGTFSGYSSPLVEQSDVTSVGATNPTSQAIASGIQAAAGSTGGKAATSSGGTSSGCAHILALRPAPPPTGRSAAYVIA